MGRIGERRGNPEDSAYKRVVVYGPRNGPQLSRYAGPHSCLLPNVQTILDDEFQADGMESSAATQRRSMQHLQECSWSGCSITNIMPTV